MIGRKRRNICFCIFKWDLSFGYLCKFKGLGITKICNSINDEEGYNGHKIVKYFQYQYKGTNKWLTRPLQVVDMQANMLSSVEPLVNYP